ncbi:MAG: hypothetical protein HYR89_06400 [Actinobacteria bacterium]|nr:hypothetical protein [Actinomycetota bacterium]
MAPAKWGSAGGCGRRCIALKSELARVASSAPGASRHVAVTKVWGRPRSVNIAITGLVGVSGSGGTGIFA